MREIFYILGVLVLFLIFGLGLVNISEQTKAIKKELEQTAKQTDRTAHEVELLKKELSVTNAVCEKIINKDW